MKKRYIISLSILGLITAAALSILIPYWVAGETYYNDNYDPNYPPRVINNYSNFQDFKNAYEKNVNAFPNEKLMIFDTSSVGISHSYCLKGGHSCKLVDDCKTCLPDDEFHYCRRITSYDLCTLDGKPFFNDLDDPEPDVCFILFHNVDEYNSLSEYSWIKLDEIQSLDYKYDYGCEYGCYTLTDIKTNITLTTLLFPNLIPVEKFRVEISEERYNERLSAYDNLKAKLKDIVIKEYVENLI